VRENIIPFGGDPEKITIFGESAGGFAVHAQVLSPSNIGKIAGAISQSGTLLFYGAKLEKDNGAKANQLSESVNCTATLDQANLYCLQQVDAVELMNNLSKIGLSLNEEGGYWKPVVDSFTSDPFLPMQPLEAMVRGQFNKIPFMSGTIEKDGWFLAKDFANDLNHDPVNDSMEKLISDAAKSLLLVPDGTEPEGEALLVAEIMRKIANGKREDWQDLVNDATFLIPDQVTVESMVQHNPNVFNYIFTQKNDWSPIGTYYNFTEEDGPYHADELPFLFDVEEFPTVKNFTEEEKHLSRQMIKYWANFAKYGNPSPKNDNSDIPIWNPVTLESGGFMNLTASPIMEPHHLRPVHTLLWKRMVYGPIIEGIEARMVYETASEFLSKQLSNQVII